MHCGLHSCSSSAPLLVVPSTSLRSDNIGFVVVIYKLNVDLVLVLLLRSSEPLPVALSTRSRSDNLSNSIVNNKCTVVVVLLHHHLHPHLLYYLHHRYPIIFTVSLLATKCKVVILLLLHFHLSYYQYHQDPKSFVISSVSTSTMWIFFFFIICIFTCCIIYTFKVR